MFLRILLGLAFAQSTTALVHTRQQLRATKETTLRLSGSGLPSLPVLSLTSSEQRQSCGFGTLLCQRNNTKVWALQSPSGQRRVLQFGNTCGEESSVICKSVVCKRDKCGECACDDQSTLNPTLNAYHTVMYKQVGPLCHANGSSRVLFLGLGGGSLARYMLHNCPGMSIDGVEISADVISMARDYFGFGALEKQSARFRMEHNDAYSAVSHRAISPADKGSYDAVFVDCFQGSGVVPESCRSRSFADKIKEILKPGGLLLQNFWFYSPWVPEVADHYKKTKVNYGGAFESHFEALDVPSPPSIHWVSILKATKIEASKTEATKI